MLKPWQYRSWITIRDLDFRAKVRRVLDLYARMFEGVPLGPDGYVASSDEKTFVRARCRCHPTPAPGQARAMRVNHEYGRGGAVAYLAAYDVHHAKVFGRCEPKTGIVPFMAMVTQVMTQEPYASARGVLWTVDNGSSHRGKKAIDRLTAVFPKEFTTTDLDDLPARLDRHTPAERQEGSSTALAGRERFSFGSESQVLEKAAGVRDARSRIPHSGRMCAHAPLTSAHPEATIGSNDLVI